MLQDQKVVVDPRLIAWLETQPEDKEYNFWGECVLDLYIKSATTKHESIALALHLDICGGSENYYNIAALEPWTFGAALARARKIQQAS